VNLEGSDVKTCQKFEARCVMATEGVDVRTAENRRLIEQIEKKHGKSVEELYEERGRRIRDAIELRVPDRVPVVLGTGVFAARYGGLPASALFYDHPAYREACKRMILDQEPDLVGYSEVGLYPGVVWDLLEMKHQRWGGGGLPPDLGIQFVEGEYMTADEYDLFIMDPSDFMMRYYLPRAFGALAPFSKLPSFRNLVGTGFAGMVDLFARPEYRELASTLYKAGQERQKGKQLASEFTSEMTSLGFPMPGQTGTIPGGAPFDTISDYLRGMRGTMLDMYRCPDKLLAACDKILEWKIAQATPADSKKTGNPDRSGPALHRGSDGFMSIAQFEKFYWPGLKRALMAAIDLGYVAAPFCEGKWDDRLEYWLQFPKGKILCFFDQVDMFRAKQILGGHVCIQGNVPASLLEVGSPQDVEEYCKKLIKVCGKDGGFILSASTINPPDAAKPANIKAMIDAAKKYGRYK
jgi:hypothetical protein